MGAHCRFSLRRVVARRIPRLFWEALEARFLLTAPIGSLDLVSTLPNGAPTTLFGWAFDADAAGGGAGAVQVRLDVDGTKGTAAPANLSRSDLQPVLGSSAHAFQLRAPTLATGKHTLKVVALDIPTGTATVIGTRTVSIGSTAFGFVNGFTPTEVFGWAFDSGLGAQPANVQVN